MIIVQGRRRDSKGWGSRAGEGKKKQNIKDKETKERKEMGRKLGTRKGKKKKEEKRKGMKSSLQQLKGIKKIIAIC